MSTTTSFLTAYQPQDEAVTKPHLSTAPKPLISAREYEVLHLIAYEYSSKEIAQKLYVSYETINSHRKNMMEKLGVKNTAGLVRVAFERQLLSLCSVLLVLIVSVHFSNLQGQELVLDEINFQVRGVEAKWDNATDDGTGGKSDSYL